MKVNAIAFIGLILVVIMAFCFKGLFINQHVLASNLIDRDLPEVHGPSLSGVNITTKDIRGPYVLHVFASWCGTCRFEHAFWQKLPHKYQVIGLAFKDYKPRVAHWLELYGNPYQSVILDPTGRIGINLGIYGTPETYVIDANGKVRYRHVGEMTEQVWQAKIKPILVAV